MPAGRRDPGATPLHRPKRCYGRRYPQSVHSSATHTFFQHCLLSTFSLVVRFSAASDQAHSPAPRRPVHNHFPRPAAPPPAPYLHSSAWAPRPLLTSGTWRIALRRQKCPIACKAKQECFPGLKEPNLYWVSSPPTWPPSQTPSRSGASDWAERNGENDWAERVGEMVGRRVRGGEWLGREREGEREIMIGRRELSPPQGSACTLVDRY